MTSSPPDSSQRAPARLAGLALLLSFPIVVLVNFGIFEPLFIGVDSAQAARNIVGQATLFRLGLAGTVLYSLGVVVVSAALHVLLEPVDRGLALLATLGRLVYALTWLLVTTNLFTALRVLTRAELARAFPPDQLPALARLFLSGSDHYYVGLLFWSLASALGAWLWLQSGSLPRALAVSGVLAGSWCAACTLVYLVFPGLQEFVNLWWFDMPMVIFELALGLLLLRGTLRGSGAAGPAALA